MNKPTTKTTQTLDELKKCLENISQIITDMSQSICHPDTMATGQELEAREDIQALLLDADILHIQKAWHILEEAQEIATKAKI